MTYKCPSCCHKCYEPKIHQCPGGCHSLCTPKQIPACQCYPPLCLVVPASAAGTTVDPGAQELLVYGYIFNTSTQVVALEADITFDSNGVLLGIAHLPGTSSIIFESAGNYSLWFVVTGVEPNQFTLFLNGAPISSSTYSLGVGTQANSGMVIITAAAGDNLTLRNHTSTAAVTLPQLIGGTQRNANATILIQKVSS